MSEDLKRAPAPNRSRRQSYIILFLLFALKCRLAQKAVYVCKYTLADIEIKTNKTQKKPPYNKTMTAYK